MAPVRAITDTPLLGQGLGMGTNVAAGLLYGKRDFLLAEGEWERVVRESGPILGFFYIGLRLAILGYLCRLALRGGWIAKTRCPCSCSARRRQDSERSIRCSDLARSFCGFWRRLLFGRRQPARHVGEASVPLPQSVSPVTPLRLKSRGRSLYAEQLHGI